MRIVSWTVLAALSIAPIATAQSSPEMPGRLTGDQVSVPAPAAIANTPDPAIGAVVSAVMPAGFGLTAVKGLPFSATQTTIHEQTLADGTVIKNTVEVQLWRDAEGRMRAESTLKSKSGDAQQTHIVAVWNPIDRTEISWVSGSPQASFATVLHLPELQMNGLMGMLVTPPPPPLATLSRPLRTVTAPAALPSAASPDAANIHTETLPPDTISGLEVAGTRTTRVIPAGTVDNDREFTVVSEIWTSAELKVTVRQMTSDPRTGTVTIELTNIDRSDPDSTLFKPPVGYKLMDLPDLTNSGSGTKH